MDRAAGPQPLVVRGPRAGPLNPRPGGLYQDSILQWLCRRSALHPALIDSILGLGFMGRCTPPNPRGSFLTRERNQSSPGRPRPPYLCATIGTLGKSFLEVSIPRAKDFSAFADSLAGLQEAHFSKQPHLGRGGFLRGHSQLTLTVLTSTVPRAVRPPLNALFVKVFSHKKPCAGVGVRTPPSQPQDAILNKGLAPCIRVWACAPQKKIGMTAGQLE